MSGHKPTLYDFGCKQGHRWEDFGYHDQPKTSVCPECGADGARRYSTFVSPVSFGKHMFPALTPEHRRKPQNAAHEQRVWDAQKAAGVSLHPAPGKG